MIISPVRNEADHLERVAHSMAAQTVPPGLWLVVDDHSTDETPRILDRLAGEIPFMRVLRAPVVPVLETARDRLSAAAAPRVFNHALGFVDREYDFIGKLDGDCELPADYFEQLLARFAADTSLGIAGGDLVERFPDGWRRIAIPPHHVPGALKLYSRECFAAIGGIRNTLGWDTIDEASARAKGFTTRSYRDLVVKHHRHWGSADGKLRGRARHGVCAWIVGYPLDWALLRTIKLAAVPPFGLSGGAFLLGYVRAAVRRTPRVERDLRAHVRAELRRRVLSALRRPVRRPHAAKGSSAA